MSDFVSNYGANVKNANDYFRYDFLKRRIYEIEEGKPHRPDTLLALIKSACLNKVEPDEDPGIGALFTRGLDDLEGGMGVASSTSSGGISGSVLSAGLSSISPPVSALMVELTPRSGYVRDKFDSAGGAGIAGSSTKSRKLEARFDSKGYAKLVPAREENSCGSRPDSRPRSRTGSQASVTGSGTGTATGGNNGSAAVTKVRVGAAAVAGSDADADVDADNAMQVKDFSPERTPRVPGDEAESCVSAAVRPGAWTTSPVAVTGSDGECGVTAFESGNCNTTTNNNCNANTVCNTFANTNITMGSARENDTSFVGDAAQAAAEAAAEAETLRRSIVIERSESMEARFPNGNLDRPIADPNNDFEELFRKESARVISIIRDKLTELVEVVDVTHAQCMDKLSSENASGIKAKKKAIKKEEASLKRTLGVCYSELEELETFRLLNLTAMIKILKKRDKVLSKKYGDALYPDLLFQTTCYAELQSFQKQIESSLAKTEDTYAKGICGDDPLEAHCKLKNLKGLGERNRLYSVGVKFGSILILIAWFVFDSIIIHEDESSFSLWKDPALYLYSFFGNIILYNWLWGVCVYVWTLAKVNYIALLKLHKSHNRNYEDLFNDAASYTLIFMVNLVLFQKSKRRSLGTALNSIPSFVYPLSLCGVFGIILGYKYYYQMIETQGVFTQKIVMRILWAPCATVSFTETYACDVLTSFVRVLSSGAFGLCYLVSDSYANADASLHQFGYCQSDVMSRIVGLLSILPLWWRFMQCAHMVYTEAKPGQWVLWPHSFNIVKYLLGLVVVLLSLSFPFSVAAKGPVFIFHVVLFIVLVVATCYATLWDIYCDWGLGVILPTWENGRLVFPERMFLRPRLMYANRHTHIYSENIYYVAMIADFIMRAMWTVSLIPQNIKTPYTVSLNDALFPFLAAVELVRRAMWGCLRMEHEHLKRATAQLEPLHPVVSKSFVGLHIAPSTKKKAGDVTHWTTRFCGDDYSANPNAALVNGAAGCVLLLLVYLICNFTQNY